MILFDINSYPTGLDIQTWFDLVKSGYCLYDGKLGEKPLMEDDENLALYDVNSMSDQEIVKAKNLIDEIIARRKGVDENAMNVINENNKRLIAYLREINKP